jgi:hypothetical protein
MGGKTKNYWTPNLLEILVAFKNPNILALEIAEISS